MSWLCVWQWQLGEILDGLVVCVWQRQGEIRDELVMCWAVARRDLMVFGNGKERFDGCVCLARRDLMVVCLAVARRDTR